MRNIEIAIETWTGTQSQMLAIVCAASAWASGPVGCRILPTAPAIEPTSPTSPASAASAASAPMRIYRALSFHRIA